MLSELRYVLMSTDLFYSASSVEIFYLHAADRTTPFEVTFKALDELYKEGKFRRLGVSNFMSYVCSLHDSPYTLINLIYH